MLQKLNKIFNNSIGLFNKFLIISIIFITWRPSLRRHQFHAEGTSIEDIASVENWVNHPHERRVKWESILKNQFHVKIQVVENFINFRTECNWRTLNVNESKIWSFPSLSFNFLRSSARGESGSTLMIFTFHSYNESLTNSTCNTNGIKSCTQIEVAVKNYLVCSRFKWRTSVDIS